jgi:hypothetical protein
MSRRFRPSNLLRLAIRDVHFPTITFPHRMVALQGQSGALTVRKWPTTARRRHANDLLENPRTKIIEASNTMRPNDKIFVIKATARPCLPPLVASRL